MTARSHTFPERLHPAGVAGWLGPWLAVAGLAWWSAAPGSLPLLLAAVGVAAGAVWKERRSLAWSAGIAVTVLGILAGFVAHRQVTYLQTDWEEYWAAREDRVGERLTRELESLMESGEAGADALAELGNDPRAAPAVEEVEGIRKRYGAAAAALYDLQGGLRVWSGTHRGPVPAGVQHGIRRYVYHSRPLFGYLYITAPAGQAGTAVLAYLFRTDLPGALGTDARDFASRFRRESGENIRIFSASLAEGQAGWELEMGDRVLLSVVVDPPQPGERIGEVLMEFRQGVAGAAVLAWLLLAVGGVPGLAGAAVAAGALALVVGGVPPPAVEWLRPLFDAGSFALPGPLPLPLGRVLLVVLAAASFLAVLPRPRRTLPPWGAAAWMALLLPGAALWLHAGVRPGAMAVGRVPWVTYQAALTGVFTLLLASGLVLARRGAARRGAGAAAVTTAVLLACGGMAAVWWRGEAPWFWPALWVIPFLSALWTGGGWGRPWGRWTLAAFLGATAALPLSWSDLVQARMSEGVETLQRLAAPRDPELEEDLHRLAMAVDTLDVVGANGVELLYGALRRSGFADAGHPVWLTLWSPGGVPEEELRVGVGPMRPAAADAAAHLSEMGGPRILTYDHDDARYVLRVPLRDGRVFTAAAPPFSTVVNRSPLSTLLAGGSWERRNPLTLIPLDEGDGRIEEPLHWRRTPNGWQGEMGVRYPNAAYMAHYLVGLPRMTLTVARSTVMVGGSMLLILLFWALGGGLLRESGGRLPYRRPRILSFRTRITVALFAFFLLANALFGTLAYRSMEAASHRAAEVLAERMTEDAAGWYFEESGAMELLARRVGGELLEYRKGELREASVEELVELGLYEGWVPYPIHLILDGGEGLRASRETTLGRWRYVTAFRRLPDGDVLAAQVPLRTGASAIRSSDVLEFLGFAVLLGGLLSLGLALLVSRALTRPIQELQVASERVGAGNLDVRLPEERGDEFGEVFHAFNRMVLRINRARRQLVRTTRRTRAIMEEAAVGMLALDPDGRITHANPRASKLLGQPVEVGELIPEASNLGRDLGAWVTSFLRAGRAEDDTELHDGARRIRVRARRLGREAGEEGGGVVVALEDITDELRTERVLAWGEMARQVAHEVKNPLTPIKLSIQHIRRAWEDQRDDFADILTRNADAMLKEIDHLADIARSFSRFGAPADAHGAGLEGVDVGQVVSEVLTLYRAGAGPVAFEGEVEPGLPMVRGRASELREVLLNLLENAREASAEGDIVRVVARRVEGADGVVVEVLDEGTGMSPNVVERVLEPHFSTRSGGTGLGLAIVRRLVESWGGEVTVESTPGQGTRVRISLLSWGEGED